MSEERVEIRVAELLVRWMGGENLREATTELASMIREESEERAEIRVAELLVRWMGGENLREATTELASMIREERD